MGDLTWTHQHLFTFPLEALRHHIVCLGASGSGKTETLLRLAYGARRVYRQQVIYLDAKGEQKPGAAGATSVKIFPATHYNGWLGTPTALHNRLLSVLDFSESPYYGDVAANAVYLALHAPITPRSSRQFLAHLRPDRMEALYSQQPGALERIRRLDRRLLEQVRMRYEVFFNAVRGQLDGELSYDEEGTDAVYLRVQGFALRQEAPRLGRFLTHDFMHYIAERRSPGVTTLRSACSLSRCAPLAAAWSLRRKDMRDSARQNMPTAFWMPPTAISCTPVAIPFRSPGARANAYGWTPPGARQRTARRQPTGTAGRPGSGKCRRMR